MMQCERKVVLAAVLALLSVMPAVCLGFSGKVSYADGSPAVGAKVSVTALATDKKVTPADSQRAMVQQLAGMKQQHKVGSPHNRGNAANDKAGQSVPPPPGAPLTAKKRMVVVCDANGRFSFPDEPLSHAMVQIKAANGHDYATVTLPLKAFQGGEVAVVLPHKNNR